MAEARITNWTLTPTTFNSVRLTAEFNVFLTPTELRLQIPCRVFIRLQERDDERDDTLILWNRITALDAKGNLDEVATGWFFGGQYSENSTGSINAVIDTDSLPGESNNEEWYLAAIAFPDIYARTTYSAELSRNLA
ncbi:MAG: hypothetical protein QNJ72_11640 [Pleurocapsa sp. MO_226.B13]|nr:hypothetical protein [Pleurocapsa sp. MO_226.B13]